MRYYGIFSIFTAFLFFMFQLVYGQVIVFSDEFDEDHGETFTTSGEVGTSGWFVARSGDDFGARIYNGLMELTNTASEVENANGWIFAYRETVVFDSPYETILSNNTELVSWYFNMRQIRDNPSGFGSNRFGAAFIIGATTENVGEEGIGYALVLGGTSTPNPIRLVRFDEGINSIGTSQGGLIIANDPLDNIGNDYISIHLTYEPTTNLWTLYGRNDGSNFQDPKDGTLQIVGSVVDDEFVDNNLNYMGGYWHAATAENQTSYFDNIKVQIGNPPGPVIIHTPLEDTESTIARTATATITGNNLNIVNNDRPVVWYSTDGGDSWENNYFSISNDNQFDFTIPGQSPGMEVLYYIAAKDADGVTTHPFGGSGENPPGTTPPPTFHSYTILEPPPKIDGFEFYFTTDPNSVSEENRISYPTAGMGREEGSIEHYSDDDWTYIDPEFTFYLVVLGNDELMAAEFYLNWDDTFVDVDDDDIEIGTIFPNSDDNEFVEKIGDGRMHINAVSFEGNVSPQIGDYLAKITMTVLKPGKYEIFVDDIDLRYYDENEDKQVEVPAESFPGEIKFFLGDFGSDENNGERGDGKIDFTDLMLFSGAYWSERGDDGYRTKYDIGPTDEGGYFSMPAPDGVIDFEDLIIFAIGYFRSAGGILHKQVYEPLRIVAYEPQVRGSSVVLPLAFEGNVNDVRAVSLTLGIPGSALTFTGATAAGELDQDMGFIASREADGIVQLDASIIRSSFSQEGIFAHLYFDKNESFDPSSIGFISAIARNSHNEDIPVEVSHYIDEHHRQTPATFKLLQNYPNPFNPVTTIEYQIPEDTYVNIVIYNVLGKEVAVLVNEHIESGYYSVEWDGTMFNNKPAPSGLYMYRMKAGNYIETKRMMLIK